MGTSFEKLEMLSLSSLLLLLLLLLLLSIVETERVGSCRMISNLIYKKHLHIFTYNTHRFLNSESPYI